MEELIIDSADVMHVPGVHFSLPLAMGDLVMLDSPLGVSKMTMIRGVAEGMGMTGWVASPTFIIVSAHRSLGDGPGLVYVDAYRLESLDEVDALDLNASLDTSATVVEWGEGKIEVPMPDYLTIKAVRSMGGEEIGADCPRKLAFEATGKRFRETLRGLEAGR